MLVLCHSKTFFKREYPLKLPVHVFITSKFVSPPLTFVKIRNQVQARVMGAGKVDVHIERWGFHIVPSFFNQRGADLSSVSSAAGRAQRSAGVEKARLQRT